MNVLAANMTSYSEVRERGRGRGDVVSAPLRVSKREPNRSPTPFHWDIWLLLCVENILLDFGRPILALYVTKSFPLSLPSLGDYCHLLYNVITAVCIKSLLQRTSHIPAIVKDLIVIVFVMGASIHLVGDSFGHRLIHCGYQLHLSVRENPILQNLSTPCLLDSFELMYFYDEQLGHVMWYLPLFGTYFICYCSSFCPGFVNKLTPSMLFLVVMSSLFNWYLVTEGQLIVLFLLITISMVVVWMVNRGRGLSLDVNGQFLLVQNLLTGVLVMVWVAYLWNDTQLRRKYPGWLYIPEPWAYWTLYHF